MAFKPTGSYKPKGGKPKSSKMSLSGLVSSLSSKPTAEMIGKEKWDNVQALFTDLLSNPQTPRVKAIIDKYAEHVAAYFAYSPLGGDSYSVELLFDDDAIAAQCLQEYRKVPTR